MHRLTTLNQATEVALMMTTGHHTSVSCGEKEKHSSKGETEAKRTTAQVNEPTDGARIRTTDTETPGKPRSGSVDRPPRQPAGTPARRLPARSSAGADARPSRASAARGGAERLRWARAHTRARQASSREWCHHRGSRGRCSNAGAVAKW